MDYQLRDKVVLITGATGGIGQALTQAFAQEGCKLAISSTRQEKLDAFTPSLGLSPDRLKTFLVDVTDEQQVQSFVDGAAAYFGRIDVMVINAGYEGKVEMIQDAQYETYRKVFDVNLFGPLYCMKYAAPHMIAQHHGAIVTIASNGSYTGSAGMSAYCASKHAVAGLVKSVALELGPQGIHCNYICPDDPPHRAGRHRLFLRRGPLCRPVSGPPLLPARRGGRPGPVPGLGHLQPYHGQRHPHRRRPGRHLLRAALTPVWPQAAKGAST